MSRWDVKPNNISQEVPYSEYGVTGIALIMYPDNSIKMTISTETGEVTIELPIKDLELFLKGTFISTKRLELLIQDASYILGREES